MKKIVILAVLALHNLSWTCDDGTQYEADYYERHPTSLTRPVHDQELPLTTAERSAAQAFVATSLAIANNGRCHLIELITGYLIDPEMVYWMPITAIPAKNKHYRNASFKPKKLFDHYYFSECGQFRTSYGGNVKRLIDPPFVRIAKSLPLLIKDQQTPEPLENKVHWHPNAQIPKKVIFNTDTIKSIPPIKIHKNSCCAIL